MNSWERYGQRATLFISAPISGIGGYLFGVQVGGISATLPWWGWFVMGMAVQVGGMIGCALIDWAKQQ